jgi:hypothetical protein
MRGLAILALLLATPAFAQEPAGCDKFKWPLDTERALLAAAKPSDGRITIGTGAALRLRPRDEVKLPSPPSREPKTGTTAVFVQSEAARAGLYRFTMNDGAWIDVIQDGKTLKPGAFSGATGCEGLRKSVKFELSAAPFTVELTNTTATSVNLVITPDQ